MRTAIILGRAHGAKVFNIISDPNGFAEQLGVYKKLLPEARETFERIELWSSDGGCVRHDKFAKPAPAPAVVPPVPPIEPPKGKKK